MRRSSASAARPTRRLPRRDSSSSRTTSNLQLADNLTPIVNTETLAAHPDIEELLGAVGDALTTEILAELNRRVDVDRELAEDVAVDFLTEAGLIGG